MNRTVFPPVVIGTPDLTPCALAAKQTSWGSKFTRFFKQAITYTVLASLQLGTLVQTKEAYAQYVNYGGQPNTGYVAPVAGAVNAAISGYTNDGTLFMGGQRIGNPHQILHDAQIPSFMNITATRYTFTNDPTHGQGTLAQMELATTNGSDSSVLLNRLYLSPTNPYVQGAPGPYPNYQTYQGVLQNAREANYLLTNADDGKTYAFKTLTAANRQAVDLLIRELPNTSQFKAAADPLGGGTGVRVTQNGDAVALSEYLKTVKPYDYSWQPNFGATFGQNGGQNPYGGWANSNNFAPDYSEGAGPAQSFQAFIKQLQDDAVANDKKVRSQTSANSLDLSGVNPNSLFGEGYNLFQYGSNSNPNRDLENDFLRRLQSGQLTVGSADYLEASRIAQERYRIAYGTRLETGKPLQFTVAQAQQKANELNLAAVNPNELFGQGFDLFQFNKALRANGEAENVLLARLQNGELTPGSSEYAQATQIAQERLRQAYSLSLSPPPPKSIPKWKQIAGLVVGAVLTFVTAGAAAAFIGPMMGASLTAAGSVMTMVGGAVSVAGVAATAVGAAVGSFVGAVISTSITSGSFSAGLQAGVNSLKGGLTGIVVNTALAMAGISAGGMQDAVGGALGVGAETAGRVSSAIYSTISGSITNTLIGNGNFGQNLVSGAINGVVDVVAASAANTIGGAFPNPDGTNLANYAAHAVVGCASAAAKGGDCASGAIGAAAGEAAAATGFISWAAAGVGQTLNDNSTAFFGGLVGGTVAAAVGSGSKVESNFATGTATATNAVTNNYLNHKELSDRATAEVKCSKGDGSSCGTVKALDKLSAERNATIEEGLFGATVEQKLQIQSSISNTAIDLFSYKNDLLQKLAVTSDPDQKAQLQLQINGAENNIQQIAGLSKTNLLLLYQQTGNETYNKAYTQLQAATSGNDLGNVLTNVLLQASIKGKAGSGGTLSAEDIANHKLQNNGWKNSDGTNWYPPNNGAILGTETASVLPVGAKLNRFGGTNNNSSYLSSAETPINARSLPPWNDTTVVDTYVVLKPLPVSKSTVAPSYGQKGLGTQYETKAGTGMTIKELRDAGYLRKLE